MSLTVECPYCGYVRHVTHDDLLAGGWIGACPNRDPDDSASTYKHEEDD